MTSSWIQALAAGLILAQAGTELLLERLNRRHVAARAENIPEALAGFMEPSSYRKSVAYTLAKSRFARASILLQTFLLGLWLFSGLLPWWHGQFVNWFGSPLGSMAMAGFLWATGMLISLPSWPLDFLRQFRLESRFGFNTSTVRLWWMDRLKSVLLSLILGYPLLTLLLKLVDWVGTNWWLWGWACVFGFQLLMILLAPALILPLFNKLTPLPEGELRQRLIALAKSAEFPAQNIQVMDGSKRSRHANAFFTGFGRFRKIVLFDTLIAQLNTEELEAVLAHEIGHYKLRHIPKMIAVSGFGLLAGFGTLSFLSRQSWFGGAFGFVDQSLGIVLLLVALLAGSITFWIEPFKNMWSRRWEYQADQFASRLTNGPSALRSALRKLHEQNLGNLTPHNLYSTFHYSHPSAWERDHALAQLAKSGNS